MRSMFQSAAIAVTVLFSATTLHAETPEGVYEFELKGFQLSEEGGEQEIQTKGNTVPDAPGVTGRVTVEKNGSFKLAIKSLEEESDRQTKTGDEGAKDKPLCEIPSKDALKGRLAAVAFLAESDSNSSVAVPRPEGRPEMTTAGKEYLPVTIFLDEKAVLIEEKKSGSDALSRQFEELGIEVKSTGQAESVHYEALCKAGPGKGDYLLLVRKKSGKVKLMNWTASSDPKFHADREVRLEPVKQ